MKRILIVHDRQSQRGDRRRFLERSGFEVTMMDDAEACLTEVERSAPDMVVIDVLLDGPNGFEVCRQLRTRFNAQELPILLCSGIYQSPEFACEASAVGAQEYLPTSVEARELVSKVVEHLKQSESLKPSVKIASEFEIDNKTHGQSTGGPNLECRPVTT